LSGWFSFRRKVVPFLDWFSLCTNTIWGSGGAWEERFLFLCFFFRACSLFLLMGFVFWWFPQRALRVSVSWGWLGRETKTLLTCSRHLVLYLRSYPKKGRLIWRVDFSCSSCQSVNQPLNRGFACRFSFPPTVFSEPCFLARTAKVTQGRALAEPGGVLRGRGKRVSAGSASKPAKRSGEKSR
jgi:hypothetical protein